MIAMVKTNIKLLFRTRIFWFFLLLTPLVSTLILRENVDYTAFSDNSNVIVELESADEKLAYYGGKGQFVLKVYDASGSALSGCILEDLRNSGLFTVCRLDLSKQEVTQEYLSEHLKNDGNEDRMGAALYIPADFDEMICAGKAADTLTLYVLSDDARGDALISEIEFRLSEMQRTQAFLSAYGDVNASEIVDALEQEDAALPEKQSVSVAGGQGRVLTHEQNNQKSSMGYAFSFLTLGFVFSGFFVAFSAITEEKNGVLTRISLTQTSTLEYFISKFITVFIVSLLMTACTAVCSLMLDTGDLGMDRLHFIFIIFLMGLIFSTLSMFLGILMGDVMSGSVATFLVWVMSSLLSGLYFPISHTSASLKVLSFLMPQKWFLEGVEMIFVKDNGAVPMLIYTTVAYLMVVLSLGSLGLKIKRTESWGNS